jgi:hypothetical protein
MSTTSFREWLCEPVINHLKGLAMNQAELAAEMSNLAAQTTKAQAEVVAKLASLEQAVSDAGNATPEVLAALDALKSSVQSVDDLNPDAAPVDPNAPVA